LKIETWVFFVLFFVFCLSCQLPPHIHAGHQTSACTMNMDAGPGMDMRAVLAPNGQTYSMPLECEYIEPYPETALDTLAKRFPHPRDAKWAFRDRDHRYFQLWGTPEETLERSRFVTSVTTLLKQYEVPFDDKAKSEKMAANKATASNPKYAELNLAAMPQHEWAQQLRDCWRKNTSNETGTMMHECLEDHVNGQPLRHANPPPEFYLGVKFLDEAREKFGLVPIRSEWLVGTDDFPDDPAVPSVNVRAAHGRLPRFFLCGCIDLVMGYLHEMEGEKRPKTVVVVDWKRVQDLSFVDVFDGHTMKAELSSLPNTNGAKYSIQTGTYKFILESFYGLVVEKHLLVLCSPDAERPIVHRVEELPELVQAVLHNQAQQVRLQLQQ
jgi:hypothetical protein